MVTPEIMGHPIADMGDDDSHADMKDLVQRSVETISDQGRSPMDAWQREVPAIQQGVRLARSGGHRGSMCAGKDGHHCGQVGHGLSQCSVRDAEMKGWPKGLGNTSWGDQRGSAKGCGKKGVSAPAGKRVKRIVSGRTVAALLSVRPKP